MLIFSTFVNQNIILITFNLYFMFGGGAGHILEMIAKLKANDALRKKKHYFKIKKDKIERESSIKSESTIHNVEEHRKIGMYLLNKDERESTNRLTFLLFSVLIVITIVGVFVYLFG